jgi:hypothetical protein
VRKEKKKSLEREKREKDFGQPHYSYKKLIFFLLDQGCKGFFFYPILVKGYFKIGNEIIIPNVFSIYFLIIIS